MGEVFDRMSRMTQSKILYPTLFDNILINSTPILENIHLVAMSVLIIFIWVMINLAGYQGKDCQKRTGLRAGVNILHLTGKLFPVKIGIFGLAFPYSLTKSVKTTDFSPLINGE